MKKLIFAATIFCAAIFCPAQSAGRQSAPQQTAGALNPDPEAAQIITSDIDNFWKAFDAARPENSLNVFRDQYLRKGSSGLREFTRSRIGSACELVEMIEAHPKYYRSIREVSLRAHTFRGPIRAAFRKLKALYGPALFPEVYLLVGRMNSGGTYTENALLIGVEMYGRTKDTPLEELKDWHRQVIKPIEELPHIVAHELIHYQQKYPRPNKTLLGMSVGEGAADFVAELISGDHINRHLHAYGDPREAELWREFRQSMATDDASLWLYNGGRAQDRPADLGYYVGYKIAESYYKHAPDKKQAIKDILEIQDFERFLKASRYEEKFGGQPSGPGRAGAP